jgi:regulatory protein
MTLISLKSEISRFDGAIKAKFQDGSEFLFRKEYLPDSFVPISSGERELSPEEEEAFAFAAECYRAEKCALRLIARAEQNSPGLSVKLERQGFSASAIKKTVLLLMEQEFLDDLRYAELWIRSRLSAGKAFTPQWLLINLGKRGIGKEISQKALKKVLAPETEYALLLKYLEKIESGKESTQKNRAHFSLRSHLKYSGFSLNVIIRYFEDFEKI